MSGEEVIAGVMVASEMVKGYEQYQGARSQTVVLDQQSQMQQLQYLQKSNSRLDQIEKLLDTQEAVETTKGVSLSSPSFLAIQRNTLNTGAKELENLKTEEQLRKENIENKRRNINNSLFASIFGDVSDAAGKASALKKK